MSAETNRLLKAFTKAVVDIVAESHLTLDEVASQGRPVGLLERKLAGTAARGLDLEDVVRISDAIGIHPMVVFERVAMLEEVEAA